MARDLSDGKPRGPKTKSKGPQRPYIYACPIGHRSYFLDND